MWVAQITEPATQGQHNEQLHALQRRFPGYVFSIMMGKPAFIIARPDPRTVLSDADKPTEEDMLRHILTELLDEVITRFIGAEMEA